MYKMVSAFGPLEYFRLINVSDGNTPLGHDAPRSPEMDPRVWEIKFGHRDDCISALNVRFDDKFSDIGSLNCVSGLETYLSHLSHKGWPLPSKTSSP